MSDPPGSGQLSKWCCWPGCGGVAPRFLLTGEVNQRLSECSSVKAIGLAWLRSFSQRELMLFLLKTAKEHFFKPCFFFATRLISSSDRPVYVRWLPWRFNLPELSETSDSSNIKPPKHCPVDKRSSGLQAAGADALRADLLLCRTYPSVSALGLNFGPKNNSKCNKSDNNTRA